MIAIDLHKQQVLDADLKAIQQILSNKNLDWVVRATMFFINEEAKEPIWDFSQGTVKVLWIILQFYFVLI